MLIKLTHKNAGDNLKAKISFESILLGLWIIHLTIYALLELSGLPLGFKIWPLGEDRNWIMFFNDKSRNVAQHLWAVDGRNPLSPWWYVAAGPLITGKYYGLHIVSLFVSPFLAIVTFRTLNLLSQTNSVNFFAAVSALAILFWTFNDDYCHVMWNFYAAIGLTLLCLYYYCRYIDAPNDNSRYFFISGLCYLITISTYTLQSGALIGIFAIGFFRRENKLYQRIIYAAKDTGLYGIIFLVFNLIWSTSTPTAASTWFSPSGFNFSLSPFFASLTKFAIPATGFERHYQTIYEVWDIQSAIAFAVLSTVIALIAVLITFKYSARHEWNVPFRWIGVVLLSIGAPILLLESISQVFIPGTRSPMVQPVFVPLLYSALVFIIVSVLPDSWPKNRIAAAIMTLLVAIIIWTGFAYNQKQVLMTYYQRHLAKALLLQSPNKPTPHTYFIILKDFGNPNLGTETYYKNYGSTVLGPGNLVNVLKRPMADGKCAQPLTFTENDVKNFGSYGDNSGGKYEHVTFVHYDGKKVTFPEVINEHDVANFCVIWQRRTSIRQVH